MHSVFICITTAALHSPFNWPFGSYVGFCVLMFSFYYKPHSPGTWFQMLHNCAICWNKHFIGHIPRVVWKVISGACGVFFNSVCFVGNHNEWVIYNTKKSPAFQVWWLHYNQSSSSFGPLNYIYKTAVIFVIQNFWHPWPNLFWQKTFFHVNETLTG